jgi:hypothetical protein
VSYGNGDTGYRVFAREIIARIKAGETVTDYERSVAFRFFPDETLDISEQGE